MAPQLKRIDRFTTEGTFKKGGKVTNQIKRVVSQDKKVLTFTHRDADVKNKPNRNVIVHDKR